MTQKIVVILGLVALTGCSSPVRQGQLAFDDGDYDEARSNWASMAENGNADAQLGMGRLSEVEAAQDPIFLQSAAEWYYLSAAQGTPEAMYRLGSVLWDLGDKEMGNKWIAYAAACGEPDAVSLAIESKLDIPSVNAATLPRDCPNSQISRWNRPAPSAADRPLSVPRPASVNPR